MKKPLRLQVHNLSRRRHQAALHALDEAARHVAGSHDVDGVIVIMSRKGKGPHVITAGGLDTKSQAVLALAQTQLGLLNRAHVISE